MHFSKLPPGAVKDELICSDSTLQIDDSNLVIKALNLMRIRSSVKDVYFKVRLDKVIPMQAGLGGGSGNAATAMYSHLSYLISFSLFSSLLRSFFSSSGMLSTNSQASRQL